MSALASRDTDLDQLVDRLVAELRALHARMTQPRAVTAAAPQG